MIRKYFFKIIKFGFSFLNFKKERSNFLFLRLLAHSKRLHGNEDSLKS